MLIFGGRRCWLIPNTGLPETNSKLAPAKMDGWFNTILFFWVGCYVGFRECTWHGGCWTKCRNQGCGGIRRPSYHQFWDVHVVRTLIPHASIILGMQLNACKCLETEMVPNIPPICPTSKWVIEALRLESLPATWRLGGFKRKTYGLYDFKMVKGGNAAKQAAANKKTRGTCWILRDYSNSINGYVFQTPSSVKSQS